MALPNPADPMAMIAALRDSSPNTKLAGDVVHLPITPGPMAGPPWQSGGGTTLTPDGVSIFTLPGYGNVMPTPMNTTKNLLNNYWDRSK